MLIACGRIKICWED